MSKLFAALLASVIFSTAAIAADAAREKADFQRRLDSVKTLTAALQRDNDAGTPTVKEALNTVGVRQKEAEELAALGEYEVAASILDEAYKKLTTTLMKAKSGEGFSGKTEAAGSMTTPPPEKLKADFERKLTSASALLDAERRVDGEKNNSHQSEIAAHEAAIAKARSTAARGDFAAANQQIDDVLNAEKRLIAATKSDRATAGLKTGSAAADLSPRRDLSGMSDNERKEELAKTLRSTAALRDLLDRRSKEQGIDKTAALGKIDQLLGEARQLAPTDPRKAQQVAGNAYEAARSGLDELRGK